MTQSEEAALVRRMIRMDEAAWEEFARGYHRPLLAFAEFALGLDRSTSEEVVEMTFVRCVKSIGTFDPARGSLFGWLKRIAANESHTFARSEARHGADVSLSALPGEVADQIIGDMKHVPLPEEILEQRDFRVAVTDALMSLSERYRRLLTMKYVDGLKVAEISLAVGSSPKAVESALVRAREAFARAFGPRQSDFTAKPME